ncbi:MAG: DUF1592 domain-containing protein [Myxococcales bacterium]|nr:DUF1592 domain-containing protein [Myxococcales bacterium]
MILFFGLLGCPASPEADPPFEPELQCVPSDPASAGDTPLRRLTAGQYHNAVADLFGVDVDIPEVLGADETVGTFTSNSVTPVSQITVEQYVLAAEAVATAVDLDTLAPCNLLVEEGTDCAQRFVRDVSPRVYRRPTSDAEQAALMEVYDAFAADRGHVRALRVVVGAMLQTPWFLYHSDYEAAPGAGPGELVPLEPHALASRLSFFLWNTTPDDALLQAATEGSLSTVPGLTEHALRMLADPRAARAIGDFHLQWLGVDELPDVAKDPDLFPAYDTALQAALRHEVADFADDVIRHGDGELHTLLTSTSTVPSEPLFAFYGITPPADWQPGDRITLAEPRAGLLTRGGVLARHAHYQRGSITLRGKLVREDLFCQELPDPPPDVDITLPPPSAGQTSREAIEAHMGIGGCAGCHSQIDPIGFAFEGFDAIGQARTHDNGSPIDATGELLATDVDGPFDGPAQLAEQLAGSRQLQWCVTRQWFRYALGRIEEPRDACSLHAAFDAFDRPAPLRELILEIVTSDAFRHRRSDG